MEKRGFIVLNGKKLKKGEKGFSISLSTFFRFILCKLRTVMSRSIKIQLFRLKKKSCQNNNAFFDVLFRCAKPNGIETE